MDLSLILWILRRADDQRVVGYAAAGRAGCATAISGLLFGAWAKNFTCVGTWTLLALAVMAGFDVRGRVCLVDPWENMLGGLKRAMAGAAIGGIVGLLLWVPGILLGPFV